MSRFWRSLVPVAGFAVVVGLAAWFGTGAGGRAIGSLFAHPSASPSLTARSAATPTPRPQCPPEVLLIDGPDGQVSDCIGAEDAVSCRRSDGGETFDVALELHGSSADYVLTLEFDHDYHGSGSYELSRQSPWSIDSGTTRAELSQVSRAGALWLSTSGTVTIDSGGFSGSVVAFMSRTGQVVTPPDITLSGAWSCSAKQSPGCSPSIVVITAANGTVTDCIISAEAASCHTSGGGHTFDAVLVLPGARHDYLLQVELDGNYQGAGTYLLGPWTHEHLDAGDGIAKVALQVYFTRALWHSSQGALTVNADGMSGSLVTVLSPSTEIKTGNIDLVGAWNCGWS